MYDDVVNNKLNTRSTADFVHYVHGLCLDSYTATAL